MSTKRVRGQLRVILELAHELRMDEGEMTRGEREVTANSLELAVRVIRTDLKIRQRPETAEERKLRESAGL